MLDFKAVLETQRQMLNAVTVVTVTLRITYVCVMRDGRVLRVIYQTVQDVLAALDVEPVMSPLIHHDV